jgi:hypothetical protein
MALGKCPVCEGKVSSAAETCPRCGNTRFRVPTGRVISQECVFCGGGVPFFESNECPSCSGYSHRYYAELRDLRDGSLHLALI